MTAFLNHLIKLPFLEGRQEDQMMTHYMGSLLETCMAESTGNKDAELLFLLTPLTIRSTRPLSAGVRTSMSKRVT